MDKTAVCNMALAVLGETGIAAPEQDCHRAKMCALFYDSVRTQLLRAHDWNFAACAEPLARLDRRVPGWEFVYAYPARGLFVRRVFAKDRAFEACTFEELNIRYDGKGVPSGKVICTDIPDAWVRFTADAADPSQWDPLFARAVACKLAEELAPALTGKTELAQLANQKYMQAVEEARLVNKWEDRTFVRSRSPMLEAR